MTCVATYRIVIDVNPGIESTILNVSSGSEMKSKGRQLVEHFRTHGTPIMIGTYRNLFGFFGELLGQRYIFFFCRRWCSGPHNNWHRL
jgi:hypothetical protein